MSDTRTRSTFASRHAFRDQETYERAAIEAGLEDARAGRVISNDEARRRADRRRAALRERLAIDE